MDRVDDVSDRRRVERRARVGTRRSQARAGVDDHGGHGEDDDDGDQHAAGGGDGGGHDGGGGGGIPTGIGGVSPHPGGHGGEWYGSGMGDDLGQGGGGLGGGPFGDYFIGVPSDDHAVHESQTWEDDAERRRTQITGTQAHLDVDLNEPPSGPAHEYFALGGTPPSAYAGGVHSVAEPSTAPVHGESLPSGSSARPLPG
nr:protein argonaute 2-like [Arachis hypogaea]